LIRAIEGEASVTTPSDTSAVNPTRELAAIMFSDVVGYTAIMGRNEREGLRAVREHRTHLRATLPRFNGRLIGEIGDGTLSSFHSAIDAVNCARELQAALVEDPELRLRIGIHVGDVVFTDNTVLGDGVNVASRIHDLAPPGGSCISERVYEEIRNKPEFQVKDLGEKKLKNVPRPIHVYVLTALNAPGPPRPSPRSAAGAGESERRKLAAGIGALLLAAVVILVTQSRWFAPALTTPPAAPPRAIRSIAVLPLDNFSGDPGQEYFADGMTDELTTDLATISGLRVISRGSAMRYKGAQRPTTPEIAKLLNVDAVVEGSVMRVGDQVRITAQLIDAPADRHLWAKSYERNSRDVLALQDEVALAIAREIKVELTPDEQARFANSRTVNPQAHEAYLKGRYFLSSPNQERVRKAHDQFELAIKADPDFALAYTGIADAYVWGQDWYFPAKEVMPKARAAAEKALQLDDTLAEAHFSLGAVKAQFDFDWPGGEHEIRRAIELNPSYAYAHDQYGIYLALHGRLDEALAQSVLATELDPLSPVTPIDMAMLLTWQTKYAAAREKNGKALELDPNSFLAQFNLGWIDIQAGKFNQAIPELEKARAMDSPLFFVSGYLGYAYAAAGERAKAEAVIEGLSRISSRRFDSPFSTAIIYLGLGDTEKALGGLEKAYESRSQYMLWLKMDKMFDPIRSEARFIALLKKVGLDK
jgi:adenylate cyclase